MGDLGSLLAGIGAIISSAATVWALVRTAPRKSDTESERAARIALEIANQQPPPDNVTAIKPDQANGTQP